MTTSSPRLGAALAAIVALITLPASASAAAAHGGVVRSSRTLAFIPVVW